MIIFGIDPVTERKVLYRFFAVKFAMRQEELCELNFALWSGLKSSVDKPDLIYLILGVTCRKKRSGDLSKARSWRHTESCANVACQLWFVQRVEMQIFHTPVNQI